MMGHGFVDWLLFIDPIPHETVDFPVNLIQKVRHLGWILFVSLGEIGCQDATGLIYAYV